MVSDVVDYQARSRDEPTADDRLAHGVVGQGLFGLERPAGRDAQCFHEAWTIICRKSKAIDKYMIYDI